MVNILSSICAVVHEQKFDIFGVVDKESFMARRHHVPRLLVAAVSDLIRTVNFTTR